HDAPEMPREFVSHLSKKLDAEFALIHANGSHTAAAAPSTNGAAHAAADAAELVEVAPQRESAGNTNKSGRSRRRWALSIVAAASVVLGAAIVSNPPAWAAAVRAIVLRIEAFATGGSVDDQSEVANVAAEQPQAPVAPATQEQPRVATAKVPKPQILIRP